NVCAEVAGKLVRYSDNGSTLSALRLPRGSLPEHADSARVLHMHRTAPRVHQRVHALFSRGGGTITAPFVRADTKVGYVVMDIASTPEITSRLRAALNAIEGTLRTRVLY